MKADPETTALIQRNLITKGLEDLDLLDFFQAMIDTAHAAKEREDKLEPTMYTVTASMFKKRYEWSEDLIWIPEELEKFKETFNGYQQGYWLGNGHRPDKLLGMAKTKRLPITMEVMDKLGKRGVPDENFLKDVVPNMDSPFSGGNDHEPRKPQGF